MHGEGGRTPSTGAGRCWPAYSSPRALDEPSHLPPRHAWQCSRARRQRHLPPEARRKVPRAMAARGERAEFLPAAQRSWLRPLGPRRRLSTVPRSSLARRPRPPLASRLPWVCVQGEQGTSRSGGTKCARRLPLGGPYLTCVTDLATGEAPWRGNGCSRVWRLLRWGVQRVRRKVPFLLPSPRQLGCDQIWTVLIDFYILTERFYFESHSREPHW